MNKMEKLKLKIIKKAKLDTIDNTINVIEKCISKMTLEQLNKTREYVKSKQMKDGVNEGNAIFLKLVDEKIEEKTHGKK